MARTPASRQPPQSIVPDVRAAARGRWAEILQAVGGMLAAVLDGQHHPCPRCGGTDRFRFTDQAGDGSIICNQCARRNCGDGLATLQWLTGRPFPDVLRLVGAYLGIDVSAGGGPGAGAPQSNGRAKAGTMVSAASPATKTPPVDPAKDLQPLPWSDAVAGLWCLSKPPITPAAILAVGGRLARYRGRYTVVDLPVMGEDGAIVGHVLYNATGGTLPRFAKGPDGALATSQVRVKLTHGSRPGLLGTLDLLPDASQVLKVEGPSDLLAALSLADLPPGVAVVTNAMGAGERPAPWMLQRFAAGRKVLTIGDADRPGVAGAELWGTAAAGLAEESRILRLPYEVTETHGRDLRDWIAEGHGWQDLLTLAAEAVPVPRDAEVPAAPSELQVIEADDDPHRLARVNLERYATLTSGRTLKFWRAEWYVWKNNRYVKIDESELRAKVSFAVKEEFDRLNILAQEAFNRGQAAGLIDAKDEPPKAKRVTPALISSVLQATTSLTSVSGDIELGTWLPTKERRNYVSMRNGILDIDAVLANAEVEQCLLPNSPDWFSTVSIPYAFDMEATCPRFEAVMEHNLSMDPERLKVCQEWAGYVLTPDTGEQKFMILEGEGSNGKSVFTAAITAMLGESNVSTVPLEIFGERFARSETLGKLLNAAGDCGELDRVAEGYLKPFTSGDRMFFDRKGVPGINCRPTARLQVACNQRPRFGDRSRGIWRRMLLIKFEVEITAAERIKGMDKVEWWERSGELPGILLWAIRGLARLRAQNGFTDCESMRLEMEDYQEEVNPAKAFLTANVEEGPGCISTRVLYASYKDWISENGYKPLSEKSFGKEVKRKFPKSDRRKAGSRNQRFYEYWNIQFSQDEICGKKVTEYGLF